MPSPSSRSDEHVPLARRALVRVLLFGLVIPGVVIGVAMGVVTLVKPMVVFGAITNPLVWAFIGGSVVVGVVLGLVIRFVKGPIWLSYVGFWLPVVLATGYGVVPAFLVTNVNEDAPTAAAPAAPESPASPPAAVRNGAPTPQPRESASATVGRATLTGIDHRASGTAQVLKLASGEYVVRFENLDVEQGPDFRVHLVPGPNATSPRRTADLGGLKASTGNQNYPIPAGTVVNAPATVLIWCRAFQVPVANATIR